MDYMYDVDDWHSALEAASIEAFDEVDSGQKGGPLARVIAEQYTHPKVQHDEGILEAAILVLGDIFVKFDPDTYRSVLDAYDGDTSSDWRELVDDHFKENHDFDGTLPGDPDDDACREWYLANAVNDNVVYTETSSGGTFYWFTRTGW